MSKNNETFVIYLVELCTVHICYFVQGSGAFRLASCRLLPWPPRKHCVMCQGGRKSANVTEPNANITWRYLVMSQNFIFVSLFSLTGQPCGGACILCVKMLTLWHMHVHARMYAHVRTARCMLEGLPRAAKIKELYWRQMMRNMASSGKYSDQTAVCPH